MGPDFMDGSSCDDDDRSNSASSLLQFIFCTILSNSSCISKSQFSLWLIQLIGDSKSPPFSSRVRWVWYSSILVRPRLASSGIIIAVRGINCCCKAMQPMLLLFLPHSSWKTSLNRPSFSIGRSWRLFRAPSNSPIPFSCNSGLIVRFLPGSVTDWADVVEVAVGRRCLIGGNSVSIDMASCRFVSSPTCSGLWIVKSMGCCLWMASATLSLNHLVACNRIITTLALQYPKLSLIVQTSNWVEWVQMTGYH